MFIFVISTVSADGHASMCALIYYGSVKTNLKPHVDTNNHLSGQNLTPVKVTTYNFVETCDLVYHYELGFSHAVLSPGTKFHKCMAKDLKSNTAYLEIWKYTHLIDDHLIADENCYVNLIGHIHD